MDPGIHAKFQISTNKMNCELMLTYYAEMQLTVGPVGPRGQNFRGSGK